VTSSDNDKSSPNLSVSVAGIPLKNPIIAASGTFGYGVEFEDVVHLDKLGGFVVKRPFARAHESATLHHACGKPQPACSTPSASRTSARRIPRKRSCPSFRQIKNVVVFANVFGYTREDYERTIEILNGWRWHLPLRAERFLPQHRPRCLAVGSDSALPGRSGDHRETDARRPLIVKAPRPTSPALRKMAHISQRRAPTPTAGQHFRGLWAIDADTRKPRHCQITAGLSGPHQPSPSAHGHRRRAPMNIP